MAFNIPGIWPLNSSNSDDLEAADRSWQWNVSTCQSSLRRVLEYNLRYKTLMLTPLFSKGLHRVVHPGLQLSQPGGRDTVFPLKATAGTHDKRPSPYFLILTRMSPGVL